MQYEFFCSKMSGVSIGYFRKIARYCYMTNAFRAAFILSNGSDYCGQFCNHNTPQNKKAAGEIPAALMY